MDTLAILERAGTLSSNEQPNLAWWDAVRGGLVAPARNGKLPSACCRVSDPAAAV
jgi:hypothetical protein